MKVIVIGAGASGLTAAIKMKELNRKLDVVILEGNLQGGKKILATGNGRCNYWNENQNVTNYHTNSNVDLSKIINSQSSKKVIEFFVNLGVIPRIKNGYYYPYSNQATTITNALISKALRLGIKILFNERVYDVTSYGGEFKVSTINKTYTANKLVVATGGTAASKTGSDGFGFELAKRFGHHIIKPLPALVQLKCTFRNQKELAGVRCDCKLSLYENKNLLQEEIGEMQFTNYGLSGICAMQLSYKISRGLDCSKEEIIKVNLLPDFASNFIEFIKWVQRQEQISSNRTIANILDSVLNYKLGNYILNISNLVGTEKVSELKEHQLIALGKNITSLTFKICGTNSFDDAQTTSGGVDLSEINLETFESNLCNSLYFCGEVLDIDGACGGYNLGFAWISGIIVGESIGGLDA